MCEAEVERQPSRRLKKPPLLAEVFCAGEQLQRCAFGTPARACSMWLPQPAQVGLLQVRQVVRWHMWDLLRLNVELNIP